MALINLKNIYKIYHVGGEEVRALDGVDISISENEYLAIMGPSGSGKSTLMNMIGCLDTPTSGIYEFENEMVHIMDDKQLASIRNRKIGFVFQTFNLLPKATAQHNVEIPLIYANIPKTERLEMSKKALSELVDLIGHPAVLGHSQGGPFCWLAADVRPDKVKACVAVEPNGPPFFNVSYGGIKHSHLNKQTFKKNDFDKKWYQTSLEPDRPNGITYSPLTYDPPLKDNEKLIPKIDENKTPENLVQCFLQKEPARKLVNLSKVKILILTAEASYHSPYDHGTSNFLKQAGVKHDFIRLEDNNIKGNGHMMMHEKNSSDIANFINQWIKKVY